VQIAVAFPHPLHFVTEERARHVASARPVRERAGAGLAATSAVCALSARPHNRTACTIMVCPPSMPTPRSSGPERLRQFRDADGVEWTVWEVDAADIASTPERMAYLDPALANGWLAFDDLRGHRRRLAPVPYGWEESTDGQLRGLLARATSVPG
jgi:hypothetical protein